MTDESLPTLSGPLANDFAGDEVGDLLAGHAQELAEDVVVVLAHDGRGAPHLAGRIGHAPGDAGVLADAYFGVLLLYEEAAGVQVRVLRQLAVHQRREGRDAGGLEPALDLERVERRRPGLNHALQLVLIG